MFLGVFVRPPFQVRIIDVSAIQSKIVGIVGHITCIIMFFTSSLIKAAFRLKVFLRLTLGILFNILPNPTHAEQFFCTRTLSALIKDAEIDQRAMRPGELNSTFIVDIEQKKILYDVHQSWDLAHDFFINDTGVGNGGNYFNLEVSNGSKIKIYPKRSRYFFRSYYFDNFYNDILYLGYCTFVK